MSQLYLGTGRGGGQRGMQASVDVASGIQGHRESWDRRFIRLGDLQ